MGNRGLDQSVVGYVVADVPEFQNKTKNEPIIQVRLHVQTRSSKYLVPGPGSHQAGDLFGDLSKRDPWLSGGRPGKK